LRSHVDDLSVASADTTVSDICLGFELRSNPLRRPLRSTYEIRYLTDPDRRIRCDAQQHVRMFVRNVHTGLRFLSPTIVHLHHYDSSYMFSIAHEYNTY